MRALLAHPGAHYSVADVYNGWLKGLHQIGVEVAPFNLNDRLDFYTAAQLERDGEMRHAFSTEAAITLTMKGLQAACYEWWPDVVILVSGFFVDEALCDLIRKRGQRLVLLHTESPYEDDRQIRFAAWADLNVVNDPTNLDKFRAVAPTVYLPHCYDPAIHHPQPAVPEYISEFCFVGSGYPSRVEFFEQVDWTGIDAQFAGNWPSVTDTSLLLPMLVHGRNECCDNLETVRRYCSTLTSANLYRREAERDDLAEGWAVGPREIELAACRTWFGREPRGESDALFPMLPTFTTPEELGDVIRWAIANPEQRDEAAVKAGEAVAGRTFDRNAAELMVLLGL